MRPQKQVSNLQKIKEEVLLHFSNFPTSHVEKLIAFQWDTVYKEFSKPQTSSVEISGFGTFKIRPKQTVEEINRRGDILNAYNKQLELDPENQKLLNKISTITEEISLLNSKYSQYQENTANLIPKKTSFKIKTNG